MTAKNMTKEQVIKALKTCANAECRKCILYKSCIENNDAANEMLLRAAEILEGKE